jgi:glycosyltransferase involved in cell wall biosynthesis
MKILTFASFPPNIGGAERRLFDICERLTEKHPDVEIDLIAYQECPKKIKNLRLYHFNLSNKTSAVRGVKYMTLGALKGMILSRKKRYDLVYAMSIFSPGVPAALTSIACGKKFVLHTSGTDIKQDVLSINYSMGSFFPVLTNALQKFVVGNADLVITDARFDHEGVKKKFPKSNSVYVQIGIDSERHRPDMSARTSLRKELGLSDVDVVVIYTGTGQRRKNLDRILLAASRLPEVKFMFVGPTREELAAFGIIPENCFVIGPVPDTTNYLKASDIFVLPSSGEGLSNALLEALSTGMPAIVSAAGDSTVWVKDGVNGYVTSSADDFSARIGSLSNNPGLIKEMGERSRKLMLDNFNWDRCIDEIYSLLENIITD